MLIYHEASGNVEETDDLSRLGSPGTIYLHADRPLPPDLLDKLDLHPLSLQIWQHAGKIPKAFVFEQNAAIAFQAIRKDLSRARCSVLVGDGYVLTSCEEPSLPLFAELQSDFKEHPKHMAHPGMILYHLLNLALEQYLKAVDAIAEEIQCIEKLVFHSPFENAIGREIYRWKGRLHDIRQSVEPLDAVIQQLGDPDFPCVDHASGFYLQDLAHKHQRIVQAMDTFHENLNGIFNFQISLKSDHTNTIVKTLTLFSVIFIPMTFIAGLYGMNFKYMPEIPWKYGYAYSLVLIFGVGGAIAWYFKKNGWWGNTKKQK